MKIDQIIRTRRKSIALIIRRDGSLIIRAPLRTSDEEIRVFVQKKAGWIQKKQALMQSITNQAAEKEFVNGEGFWFLGKSYRLDISKDAKQPLELRGRFYIAQKALPEAQFYFVNWYKQQARTVISARVSGYASKYGFHYQQVKITSAQTRWGSCSSSGTLCFTWRLVLAPVPVIDYVVVHELVHILEKNHGKAFWAKVMAIMPDYKQKIEWLKLNGRLLRI